MPKDYKLQELREQTKIQEKQSQENDKVAKNNKVLGWIVAIATNYAGVHCMFRLQRSY